MNKELKLKGQQKRVFEYLKTFKTITSMQAFTDLGVTRLSAVIFELVRKGITIYKKPIAVCNRYGEPITVTKYSLTKKALKEGK